MFGNDELLAELSKSHHRPIYLVRLDLPDGVLAVNSGNIQIPFNGDIYQPVGGAGKISAVKESGELKPHQLSLTLCAHDPALLQTAMVKDYIGCDAKIYFGALDANYQLVGAVLRFRGRITNMPVKYGKNNTIEVRVAGRFEDWKRARATRYTDAEQQGLYPGDRFCQFAPQMVEKPINWGVPGAGAASGSVSRLGRDAVNKASQK